MLYHVTVRAVLGAGNPPFPLVVAVGDEVLGELELERSASGDRFVATFEPAEPGDAVTVSMGRPPIPWPGRYDRPLAFAARLEPGLGVALTSDGFVESTFGWTLRVRLWPGHSVAKMLIRAFDANSPTSPAPVAITYDRGELIANFESLELPAVVRVQTSGSRGLGIGELEISAEA